MWLTTKAYWSIVIRTMPRIAWYSLDGVEVSLQSIRRAHRVENYRVGYDLIVKARSTKTTDATNRRLSGQPPRRAFKVTSIQSRTQSGVIGDLA